MKLIWLPVLVLSLAACSTPAEKAAPEATAPKAKGAKPDKQAMAGKHVAVKRMPASKIAGVSATTLARAIETAVQKVPGGEALAAEIEIENGEAMIDVKVFAHGKLYEVEIDAATGTVQEVDQEDDDDDDDDEDDDDEDGDDD